MKIVCPGCGGSGVIYTSRQTVVTVSCDACDGDGMIGKYPCTSCRGSGVISFTTSISEPSTCPTCRGSGEVDA